jgi:hypothetical protein
LPGLLSEAVDHVTLLLLIQALYVNATTGQLTLGDQHGGVGGDQTFITLNAGEFFTQISCSQSSAVGAPFAPSARYGTECLQNQYAER